MNRDILLLMQRQKGGSIAETTPPCMWQEEGRNTPPCMWQEEGRNFGGKKGIAGGAQRVELRK